MTEHEISYITRISLGGSPIRGMRGPSGTVVRCTCGERAQYNEAPPSKGGRRWAEKEWFPAHLIWVESAP